MKSNVLESTKTTEAVVDLTDVKIVASDVKFSTETSNAANDEFICVSHKTENCEICDSINILKSSVRSELTLEEQYEEVVQNAIAKREEYQCLITQTENSLYEVLSFCYQLALNDDISDENSLLCKVLNRYRKKQYDSKKKKVQKHSTSEHIIVRLVWAESDENYSDDSSITRSKVSAYATVLRNAKEQKVSTKEFSSWLRKSGGVDAVRRMKHSETSKRKDLKVAESMKLAEDSSVTNVIDDALSKHFTRDDCGQYFVLVAKVVSTNEIKVSGVVRKQSVLDAAINAMRSERNAANKSAEKERKERENAETKAARDRKERKRKEKRDQKIASENAARSSQNDINNAFNAIKQ
jgi:hypothetical protein